MTYLKFRLKALIQHRLHGFLLRSGSTPGDEEDEGSLYHAQKETSRKKAADMTKLRIGELIETDPERIKHKIKEYYRALYNGHHRTLKGEIVNTGVDFKPDWEYMK